MVQFCYLCSLNFSACSQQLQYNDYTLYYFLRYHCSKIVLQLHLNNFKIKLYLRYNCSTSTLKLCNNDTTITLKFLSNYFKINLQNATIIQPYQCFLFEFTLLVMNIHIVLVFVCLLMHTYLLINEVFENLLTLEMNDNS